MKTHPGKAKSGMFITTKLGRDKKPIRSSEAEKKAWLDARKKALRIDTISQQNC